MTNNLCEFEKALDKVEGVENLTPALMKHAKEIVLESATEKMVGIVSPADAVLLSNGLRAGSWKYSKVVSMVQAYRQISSEDAHKDVGTILLKVCVPGEDYTAGILQIDPVTGKITESGVQISRSGLNLILGYHNDALALAYKRYIFACFEALANEVKEVANYNILKHSCQLASNEEFSARKQTMVDAGASPNQAQAAGARIDKRTYRAILGLGDSKISATQALKDAGTPLKQRRVAKSLNHHGTARLEFLRSETGRKMALAGSGYGHERAANEVTDKYEPMLVDRDPHTNTPIGYKRQVRGMCDDRESKRMLQAQGRLNQPLRLT